MRSAGWNDPYNRECGKQKLFREHHWQKNKFFAFFARLFLDADGPGSSEFLFIQFVFTLTVVSIF